MNDYKQAKFFVIVTLYLPTIFSILAIIIFMLNGEALFSMTNLYVIIFAYSIGVMYSTFRMFIDYDISNRVPWFLYFEIGTILLIIGIFTYPYHLLKNCVIYYSGDDLNQPHNQY